MIAAIGWLGSVLCVASLLQMDARRFRTLNLSACVVLLAFNVINGTWSGAILNAVVAVINVRQIIMLFTAPAGTEAAGAAADPAMADDATAYEQH